MEATTEPAAATSWPCCEAVDRASSCWETNGTRWAGTVHQPPSTPWASPSESEALASSTAAGWPRPWRSASSPLRADVEPLDRSWDEIHTARANTTNPTSATSTPAVATVRMRSRDRRDATR